MEHLRPLSTVVCLSVVAFLRQKRYSILAPFSPSQDKSLTVDSSSLAAMPTTVSSINAPPVRTPLGHGLFFRGAEPSQIINPSRNAPPFQQPLAQAMEASPAHLPEAIGGYPLDFILNPPGIPMYGHLFPQWLQARRAWMISRGYGDPFVIGPRYLAEMFHAWLQQYWPLIHLIRIGTPVTNLSGWTGIFDFWFIALHTNHISSAPSSHTTPANTSTAPTVPYHPPSVAITSPASASSASRNNKHHGSETSALTLQQIQDGCTAAGGATAAIQRLATVFPSGRAITRGALTVDRKARADHRGYQEFTGQLRNGRWRCLLCKEADTQTWKNQKDILNHVWDKHCNPPPSFWCACFFCAREVIFTPVQTNR